MLRTLTIAAALLVAPIAAAAEPLPAAAVRSIDPADSDFSDLEPLAKAIGDARIVMLGEASHGDGSTFLAKTRVVRFLRERMGFDVLAFESGFVDLELAQRRIAAGEPTGAVLSEAVFPVWSHSDQFRPLADYLESQRRQGRPLELAGFDLQFTGKGAKRLPAELQSLAAGLAGEGGAAASRLATLVAAALEQRSKGVEAMDETALASDVAAIDSALAASRRPDAAFWRQGIASIAANLRFLKGMPAMQPATFDLRERQMASNLGWLADQRFAGRKIIVWAATSHVIRDRTAIDVTSAREMVPMGAYFAAGRPAKDSYVLAFTAAGGQAGSFARRQASDVGAAPAGSYEAELAAAGFEQALVPLRGSAGERRIGRILGYAPWTGEWGRAADGLFFIREMKPTTYPAPAAAAQSAQSRPSSR